MKKILIIIFTIAIFVTGGVFGYKKLCLMKEKRKLFTCLIKMF